MTENDKYFVERCLDGHPDDFRHLVRRYQSALTAYLAGRLGNAESAQEAAQETFVRAYFGLRQLKKRRSFHCWLLGIAGRVAKEQQRKQSRFQSIADPPAARAAKKQEVGDIDMEKAIAELPGSYRELILLRFYADYSCSRIAQQLDVPLGTVTKRLSRAYARLRELLTEQEARKSEV